MKWIKNKFLLILGIFATISALAARYFYHQSLKAKTKVHQGDAKLIAEKEKAKLESLMKEVKGAEAYRKSLVDQFRSNNPKP